VSLAPLFLAFPSLAAPFLGFPLERGASPALAEEDNGALQAFAVLLGDSVPRTGWLSLCCPKPSVHQGETSPERTRIQR